MRQIYGLYSFKSTIKVFFFLPLKESKKVAGNRSSRQCIVKKIDSSLSTLHVREQWLVTALV
jgi:hypothetical protein